MSGQTIELGIKLRYDGREVEAGAGVSRDAIKQLSSEAKGAVESAGASYTKASAMAVSSIDKIGVSAAQTTNAMRMLPAQITDIVTGLASGQAPLTVLIQQGGQIKDMFGGVGPAMRAVAGSVLSVTGVTAAAIAGVGGLAFAVKQGSEEFDTYRRQVLAANAASAASVGNLSAISASINASAGATKGALNELLTGTAANGKIAVDQLSEVADVAIRLERAGVDAADETIKRFEALGNKPAEAVLKLDEKYRFLTASTYAHIKALQDEGRETEAAVIAQKSYADALEARLPSIEQNLGTVERWWRAIKDATLGAVDAIKDIGRSKSIDEQIATLQGRIDAARKNASGSSANEAFAAENIQAWQQQIDFLKQQGQIEARNALARADADITRQASLKKEVEVSALREKYLTNEAKLRQEIKRINASTGTDAEKAAWIKQATEQLTPKSGDGAKNDWKQIYDARLAAEKDYSETQVTLVKQRVAQGLLSEEQGAAEILVLQKEHFAKRTALLAEQLAATKDAGDKAKIGQELQAVANDAQTAQAAYETALAKMAQEREKYRRSVIESIDAATAKTEEENDALRAQIDTLGMTSEQIGAYEASKKRAAAAADYLDAANLRETASTMEAAGGAADAVQYYRQLADARESAGKALSTQASLEIEKGVKQSAADAAKEWEKTSDKISDNLTDALMRGFEAGKSAAANLRDATVNMFKSMVLQPVIKATVVGGLSAIGLAPSGSAASTLGSAGNLYSAGSSAYSLYNGGYSSLYSSAATSSVGQSLGLGTTVYDATADTLMTGTTALGETVGAAIPYVGAAIAAVSLLTSALGKRGGSKTEGDAYGTLASTGALSLSAADRTGDNWITGSNSNSVVESLLTPIGTSVASLIKSLGGNASGIGLNLGFSTDPKGTAADNIQSGVMDASGAYVYRNGRNADRGSYQTELNLETQRMMVAAVNAADVSQVYKDVANSVDLYTASAEQLQTVLSNITAISSLRTAFDKLGFGAATLSMSLIDAAGGASTLSSNLESYYQNFYTEGERQATTLKQVSDAMAGLGLAMPTTREGFRDLVNAQDRTTESGQKTFAALMSLNAAFASAVPAATAASAAVTAVSETISDTMKSLQAKTADLRVELLTAQGKTAEAAAAQRAIDTSGMTAAEAAVYDYNSALRSQIDAINAATAAAETAQEAATQRVADAQSALSQAYEREASNLTALSDKMASAAKTLRAAATSLYTGSNSPLSGADQLRLLQSQFDDAARRAALGDSDAMDALPDLGSQLLAVSKENAASSVEYARTVASVDDAMQKAAKVAERQSSIAKQQLDALTAQVSSLITINTSVLSVKDAIAGLSSALAAQSAAKAAASSAALQPYSVDDTAAQRQAKVEAQTGVSMSSSDSPLVAAAKALYMSTHGGAPTAAYNAAEAAVGGNIGAALGWNGSLEDTERLRKVYGFAAGGDHAGGLRLVGENGPELEVTGPSRIFSADQTRRILLGGNTNEALAAEVKALSAVVAELLKSNSAENVAIARHLRKMAQTLEAVASGKRAFATEAAA